MVEYCGKSKLPKVIIDTVTDAKIPNTDKGLGSSELLVNR